MMEMRDMGITFGNKHTFNDFGLICKDIEVGFPEVKTKIVELSGSDGFIDLTKVFGKVMYGSRVITATFLVKEISASEWAVNMSKIANYLHGENHRIILDNDKGYYYEGRCKVSFDKEYKPFSTVSIECECKPYKVEVNAELGDNWLWDPFNFETGVIRRYKNIAVNGSYTLNIRGLAKPVIPIIISDSTMQVEFNGATYNLSPGNNNIYRLATKEGDNVYKFIGNGVISIIYKGGML